MDRHTRDKLYLNGMSGNGLLMERIKTVESMERKLDGPPEKFTVYQVDTSQAIPFGVYRDYLRLYTQSYNEAEPKDGTIVFPDGEYKCSYEVLNIVKALTVCGVCKSAERATACRELLKAILSRRHDGELSKTDVAQSLKETGNYYKDELVRAITDCAYSVEEQIGLKVRAAMKDKYNDKMLDLFKDVEDMDTFEEKVSVLYKKACADPNYKVIRTRGKLYNIIMHENIRG